MLTSDLFPPPFPPKNERLPSELGWTKRPHTISLDEIAATAKLVANASSLFTDGGICSKGNKRRDLHAGVYSGILSSIVLHGICRYKSILNFQKTSPPPGELTS